MDKKITLREEDFSGTTFSGCLKEGLHGFEFQLKINS